MTPGDTDQRDRGVGEPHPPENIHFPKGEGGGTSAFEIALPLPGIAMNIEKTTPPT